MNRKLLGASVAVLSLAAMATSADAQARRRGAAAPAAPSTAAAPAAAPAGPPITHGPPLAGVCVFSRQGAVGASSAGKAAAARLEQLAQVVRAELDPQRTSLETDAKAFEGQRASLSADARQKQEAALTQRAQAFQQLGETRRQELQLTQQKAIGRINEQVGPIAQAVYQSHNCSILLNGDDAVFAANPAMDLTGQVVQQLNTKLPTLTFDRERLPAGGAAR